MSIITIKKMKVRFLNMNKKAISMVAAILGTAAVCTYILLPRKDATVKPADNTKQIADNNKVQSTNQEGENTALNSQNKDTQNVAPNAYKEKVSATNTDSKLASLTLADYAKSLKCTDYTVKMGDTIESLSKKYTEHCNLNTVKNLLCLVNNKKSTDDLIVGSTFKIPETALTSGTLHKVAKNDTWYKLAKQYYKNYKVEDVEKFICSLNDMKNNTLVLDTTVYLPNIQ